MCAVCASPPAHQLRVEGAAFKKKYSDRRTKKENPSKSATIRPNLSPSDAGILQKIPQPNTYDAEHRTTEELIATQLRQVIAYLDISYCNFVRNQYNNPIKAIRSRSEIRCPHRKIRQAAASAD
ncbi:hypothetical protein Y032_0097g2958 [Ancylostoma ceylanicum]|uniref:Uncharacterized protein n=1 Tax=Ancylostoma ceylanicum TaxID=53326 RepID=A0A016TIL5_9BILA|nr:hypothetical protein Y032_0097g2958 [Ancylostoma ceylanicum]